MRKNNLFGNLTPLGLVLLAACKGTTTSTFIADSTGRVEDGPLLNAIAFLDYNNDGRKAREIKFD
jgi:hypothetical protein